MKKRKGKTFKARKTQKRPAPFRNRAEAIRGTVRLGKRGAETRTR